MDDQELIRLFFAREDSAITALARRFGQPLFQIALNILGSRQDAEECVSDTYMALWNAIPPASPDPLSPYVYRTGRNIALKQLRRTTAQKRDNRYDVSLEELGDCLPGGSVEQEIDARELGRSINTFLSMQTPENRYLFMRRYWWGDSIAHISKSLNMRESAVSVRLNRIRKQLKDHLIKEGYFYEP